MSQVVPLLITLFWVVLSLTTLVLARRHRISGPRISRRGTILLLTSEAAIVAVAPVTKSIAIRAYFAAGGAAFLLIGWVVSHERLLMLGFTHPPRGLIAGLVSQLLRWRPRVGYIGLLGDWIQLVGFALVWSSAPAFVLALAVMPLAVHLATRPQRTRLAHKKDEGGRIPKRWLPTIWPAFSFAARITLIALVIGFFTAVLTRDCPLFFGTSGQATALMGTLAEIEATVGALVVTLLFVFIELTTSTYSPRLTRLLATRPSFRAMLALAVSSLVLNIAIASNATRWLPSSHPGEESLIIDLALLWTVVAGLGFFMFTRDAFYMMSPESIVEEILKRFDTEWTQIVRDEWSSRHGPHSMYIDRDPMVPIERILISALDRGDINSFRATLILVHEKLRSVCNQHDGAAIDAYLADRFANVVQAAARHHADVALEYLCDHLEMTPSAESLRSADVSLFDVPPGSKLFRQIIEHAIACRLPNSTQRALNRLEKRATHAVEALPAFSELWLINRENMERDMPEDEKRALWRNDGRVRNYIHGCLYYFGEVGKKAVEADMLEASRTASRNLSAQIITIVDQIPDEVYQQYLLKNALSALYEIIKTACSRRATGAVDILFGLESVTHKNSALLISHYLASFCVAMAKAGILDFMMVISTAMATLSMAGRNPEVVLPILEAFGEAGELLHTLDDFSERQDLISAHGEILRRINQVEQAGLRPGVKTKVRRAAGRARRRAKLSKRNV